MTTQNAPTWNAGRLPGSKIIAIWANPGELIAVTTNEKYGPLLAAAPDLLAALEFIVNDTPEAGADAVLSVAGYNAACAAIAKATPNRKDVTP